MSNHETAKGENPGSRRSSYFDSPFPLEYTTWCIQFISNEDLFKISY